MPLILMPWQYLGWQAVAFGQIPYLRFQRPAVEARSDIARVISLDSIETLLASDR